MGDERSRLEKVASWYSSKEGFYSRLVEYGFRSLLPHFVGTRCLELGPADGQMTRMLLNAFSQVTSVDGSQSFCDRLRRDFSTYREYRVECALFEEYQPDGAFDTIVMTHILEHLQDPVQVLTRTKQWLSETGKLVVLVPNANSFHRLAATKMGLLSAPDQLNELDLDLGHRRVYTLELLSSHLASAGWNIEATGGVFFKPLTNSQIAEWFSEGMMDGFYELGNDFPEYAAEIYAVSR